MGVFSGLEGFRMTFGKLFDERVTGEYKGGRFDDEKRDKPMRMHGRHVLNRYEDGMEKCIGCELCAGVCPAKCIYVRGADNDPDAAHHHTTPTTCFQLTRAAPGRARH